MLVSPLRLLSYLCLRARFGAKTLMSHEHMLLGYHLKHNLWLPPDANLVPLYNNFSSALETAMIARREGVRGAGTPDGILTRMEGTHFARIVSEIEDEPSTVAIDLGLLLLKLSEDTVRTINRFVNQVAGYVKKNGGLRSLRIGIPSESTGLTIHCSSLVHSEAQARLSRHCANHKYQQRANNWFGLTVRPDGSVQVAIELTGDWEFDNRIDSMIKNAPPKHRAGLATARKIGRNDPCPCGSGRKYKHCCINR